MNILGFDPGKDKCGVALRNKLGKIELHEVIPSNQVISRLRILIEQHEVSLMVMGDQTTSKIWRQKLLNELPTSMSIKLINEYKSSLEARDLYWKMYPAKGLLRLIPEGMRLPPRPIDDLVAIILIERYLANA
jgi:RNase H-fold protein (predicted Holliday junction resolvase)